MLTNAPIYCKYMLVLEDDMIRSGGLYDWLCIAAACLGFVVTHRTAVGVLVIYLANKNPCLIVCHREPLFSFCCLSSSGGAVKMMCLCTLQSRGSRIRKELSMIHSLSSSKQGVRGRHLLSVIPD